MRKGVEVGVFHGSTAANLLALLKRTFKMFQEWYDARLIDLVFDLADGPLIHEGA